MVETQLLLLAGRTDVFSIFVPPNFLGVNFPQSGTKGNFWANPKVRSSKMNIKYSYKCTHPFISFPYDILYDSQRKKVHSLKRSLKRKLPFTTACPTSPVIIDTSGSGSGLEFDDTADMSLATGVAYARDDNVA